MVLRHVRPGDEDLLLQIFSDPTVSRWWGDPVKSVADTMNSEEGDDHYLILVDGEVVGMIQSYQETDEMYRHAGIDISIREPWQGTGLGPEAIRLLAHHLIDDLGHHRLVIDPAAHNANAIRAYERVGFRPVGIMRSYERASDGTWHDGLLMEMLADELTD